MRKDRIVEITGLAILLIQRLCAKDYKNTLITAVLDREITEENMVELALWTIAELAVGIAIAIYQEIISVIVMLLIMGFFVLPMLVKLFRFWQAKKNKT